LHSASDPLREGAQAYQGLHRDLGVQGRPRHQEAGRPAGWAHSEVL